MSNETPSSEQVSDQASEALEYSASKVSWATAKLVRQPPAKAASLSVYFFAAVIVIVAAYSWFAAVPVSIKVPGQIASARLSYPIISVAIAKVKKIYVENGQDVKKGDLLLSTDLTLSKKEEAALLKQTEDLLGLLKLDERGKCKTRCRRSLLTFKDFGLSDTIKSPLQERFSMVRESIGSYISSKDDLANIGTLLGEQYRLRRAAQSKLNSIKDKNAENLLVSDVESLKREIGALNSQIAERRNGLKNAVRDKRQFLVERLKLVPNSITEYIASAEFRAPVDGKIDKFELSGPGQTLVGGSIMMEVLPAESEMIVEVHVPNSKIANIEDGMVSLISLDAFPESEFGRVNGKISDIPITPVQAAPGQPPSYKVKIALEQTGFNTNGRQQDFKLGMTLNAEIILKKETLFRLAMQEIFKFKEDML